MLDFIFEHAPDVLNVFAALSAPFAGWFAFHKVYEEHLYFRKMKRLDRLAESMRGDPGYEEAVMLKKREEASRLLFGVKGTPMLRAKVLELYLNNVVNSEDVESAAPYFSVDDKNSLVVRGNINRKCGNIFALTGAIGITVIMLIFIIASLSDGAKLEERVAILVSLVGYGMMIGAFSVMGRGIERAGKVERCMAKIEMVKADPVNTLRTERESSEPE